MSLVIFTYGAIGGALNFVDWRYRWKPRKLVFNEYKWIHSKHEQTGHYL